MKYTLHVFVFDNDEEDYIGDIIAIEGNTIEDIERSILIERLGPIIGYTVPFVLTGVRIVGRRNGYDVVDFRDPKELFTEAINKNPNTARVLDYNNFDIFIEIRDLNNANREYNYRNENPENGALYSYPTEIYASSSSGSNKYGGKRKTMRKAMRKTMRKTKRKALKTKRHRK